jgi:hypothetical protein
MIMHNVISSNLVAVGYNSSSLTLRIQFKNGTYDYFVVPEHIYQGLMSAPSHGEYHARYIKNSYNYQRVF